MARAVLRSVRRVRPSGNLLDHSQRWAGFRQVWRQPWVWSTTLMAVAARCWRRRMVEKVGVSAGYLQSVAAGDYFPSLPTLVPLGASLRCTWNELFAGCEKA